MIKFILLVTLAISTTTIIYPPSRITQVFAVIATLIAFAAGLIGENMIAKQHSRPWYYTDLLNDDDSEDDIIDLEVVDVFERKQKVQYQRIFRKTTAFVYALAIGVMTVYGVDQWKHIHPSTGPERMAVLGGIISLVRTIQKTAGNMVLKIMVCHKSYSKRKRRSYRLQHRAGAYV